MWGCTAKGSLAARPIPPRPDVPLESLTPEKATTGFGRVRVNKTAADTPLLLDGVNAANGPRIAVRPRLRELVIAPQARTDLVIRPVNYADQLLENAVSPEIFGLLQSTLLRQVPGRPVEKALLIDSMFRLQRLLHAGFDRAAEFGNLAPTARDGPVDASGRRCR